MKLLFLLLLSLAALLYHEEAAAFAPPATVTTKIRSKSGSSSCASPSRRYGIRERLFGVLGRAKRKHDVPSNNTISERQVRDLFDRWNEALRSGDAALVADAYAEDAILIPTSSNVIKENRSSILEYFKPVVKRDPSVKIIDGRITVGSGWAQNVGIYEWNFGDGPRKKARYTFVYVFCNDGEWRIGHHHSSAMPEG